MITTLYDVRQVENSLPYIHPVENCCRFFPKIAVIPLFFGKNERVKCIPLSPQSFVCGMSANHCILLSAALNSNTKKNHFGTYVQYVYAQRSQHKAQRFAKTIALMHNINKPPLITTSNHRLLFPSSNRH